MGSPAWMPAGRSPGRRGIEWAGPESRGLRATLKAWFRCRSRALLPPGSASVRVGGGRHACVRTRLTRRFAHSRCGQWSWACGGSWRAVPSDGAAQRTWGTSERAGYRGTPTTGRQSRVLRAMGDGPSGRGEAHREVVRPGLYRSRAESQTPRRLAVLSRQRRAPADCLHVRVNHPQNEVYYNARDPRRHPGWRIRGGVSRLASRSGAESPPRTSRTHR